MPAHPEHFALSDSHTGWAFDGGCASPRFRTAELLAIPTYRHAVLGYTVYTFGLGAFAAWGPAHLFQAATTPGRARGRAFSREREFEATALAMAGVSSRHLRSTLHSEQGLDASS